MAVVGYVPADAGYVLCPPCAEFAARQAGQDLQDGEQFGVMFDSSEGDSYDTCDHCGERIEHALTTDGRSYEARYVLRAELTALGIGVEMGDSIHSDRLVTRMTLNLLRKVVAEYRSLIWDMVFDGTPRTLDNLVKRRHTEIARDL